MKRGMILSLLILISTVCPIFAQGWGILSSPTTQDISDLEFADQVHGGIITSEPPHVWLTTDGGDSWTGPHSFHAIKAISVPAYPHVYVLGTDSISFAPTVWHSTDWGGSWTVVWQRTTGNYTDLDFFDPMNGIVAGGVYLAGGDSLIVWQTTDGGTTWSNTMIAGATIGAFSSAELVDGRQGIIGGSVLPTGATAFMRPRGSFWEAHRSFAPLWGISSVSGIVDGETEFLFAADTAWGFFTGSDSTWTHGGIGHVVTGAALASSHDRWLVGPGGFIAHQGPADVTWATTTGTPATEDLNRVDFTDANHGWAVGAAGRIIRYSAGYTFIPSPIYPPCDSTLGDFPLVLFWTNSTGDPGYRVQVARSPTFTMLIADHLVGTNVDTLTDIGAGNYWWRVRIESEGVYGSWSTECRFTYSPATTISLYSPCDTTLTGENVTFRWAGGGWTQWDMILAGSAPAETLLALTDSSLTRFVPTGSWNWVIRGRNPLGTTGPWSPICYFTRTTVSTIPPPIIHAPTCGGTYGNDAVQYIWDLDASVLRYLYEIDTTGDFRMPVVSSVTGRDTSAMWYPAPLTGMACFRVRAEGPSTGEFSNWSDVCCINLEPSGLTPPRTLAPICGAWVSDASVIFAWTSTGAPGYDLQIASDSLFGALLTDLYGLLDTTFTQYIIQPHVWWRVRSQSGEFHSEWSSVCDVVSPNVPSPLDPYCGIVLAESTTVVYLQWSTAVVPARYHLQVDNDSDFASPALDLPDLSIAMAAFSVSSSGQWYWRVLAYQGVYSTDWSRICDFTIPGGIQPPLLDMPDCGATVTVFPATFSVLPGVTPLDRYQVQIDGDTLFAPPLAFDMTQTSTFFTVPSLPPGTYYWHARGYTPEGRPSPWTSACVFEVPDTTPNADPTPILPDCGSTVTAVPVRLISSRGHPVPSLYHYQVCENPLFSVTPVLDQQSPDSFLLATTLDNGIWYWRVRGFINDAEWTAWSDPCMFTLAVPTGTPEPRSPRCDSTYFVPPSRAYWSRVSGAMGYDLQFDRSSAFIAPYLSDSTPTASDTTFAIAPVEGMNYWRVRARFPLAPGPWSSPCLFQVMPTSLNPPVLYYPYCSSIVSDSNLVFYWDYQVGALYNIQLASDPRFTTTFLNMDSLTSPSFLSLPLPWNETIFWRVQAMDILGNLTDWTQCEFYHEYHAPLQPPVYIQPGCGDTLRTDSLLFAWHSAPDVAWYEFQLVSDWVRGPDGSASSIFLPDTFYHLPAPAATQAYRWRVRTCDGRQNVSAWGPWCGLLYLPDATPSVPQTILPRCGSVDVDSFVTFIWTSAGGARSYELEAFVDTFYTDRLLHVTTPDTAIRSTIALPMTGSIFWRVRAIRYAMLSDWSPICMFDREDIEIPRPQPSGACNTTISDSVVHLSWTYSGPPGLFQVQLSTDSLFTTGFSRYYNGIAAMNYDIYGLGDGVYYWRVRISHYQRVSEWADYCTFTISGRGLGQPIPTSPVCGSSVYGVPLTFGWAGLAAADSYRVQLSPSGSFTPPTNLPATRENLCVFAQADTLHPGTVYWRVQAFGRGTTSTSRICPFTWVPTGNPLHPQALRPSCNSSVSGPLVRFVWTGVGGSSYYQFHLAGQGGVYQTTVNAITLDYNFAIPGTYSWWINAVDSAGVVGAASDRCLVRVLGAAARVPGTVILYPENYITYLTDVNSVVWRTIPVADSYELQLDDEDRFELPYIATGSPVESTWTIPGGTLNPDINYYVRVRGVASLSGTPQYGPWSPVVSFRISDTRLPLIPLDIVPDTFRTFPFCLTWRRMIPGSRYDLRFGADESFSELLFDVRGLRDTTFCLSDSTVPMSLPFDTPIPWGASYTPPGVSTHSDWSSSGHIFLPHDDFVIIDIGHIFDGLCSHIDTVSEDNDDGISVTWSRDTAVTRYRFQASFSHSFNSTTLNLTTPDTTFLLRPSDFDNVTPTLYWRIRGEISGNPPGPWSRVCNVSRVIRMNTPLQAWPWQPGDSVLITTWPPPLGLGLIAVYDGNAPSSARNYEITTISDSPGAPTGTVTQSSPWFIRNYAAGHIGWRKWKFTLRMVPAEDDYRYLPSAAYTCSLFYGTLPPVVLYGASCADSSIQVAWLYLNGTQTHYKIYRTTNVSSGYSLIATVPGDQFTYDDLTARPHRTYYYKVRAYNSQFDRYSAWHTFDATAVSTFLPRRDGENYCNCGGVIWGADQFPTWNIFVRGFGQSNCVNPSTGNPRLGAQTFWQNHRHTWGGSCMGFSSVAQLFANRYNSGGTVIWGGTNWDISLASWSGGTSTGRLHQFNPASTINNEVSNSINAIQATAWGNLPEKRYATIPNIWNRLTTSNFADSSWVIWFFWTSGASHPGHQIVPYKTGYGSSGKKRIYCYDENSPSSAAGTRYVEWDEARTGSDSLTVVGYPSTIYDMAIEPNHTYHHTPTLPFAVTARYARPAGPEDWLDTGDSIRFSVNGAVEPLIVNSLPESLGYSGGTWFDRMEEGRIEMDLIEDSPSWRPGNYILNPDSFRVNLTSRVTGDSVYSVTIVRPGRIFVLDSLTIRPGQTDHLWIGPTAEDIRFSPGAARSFRLTVYHTNADWYETEFQLTTHLASGDSVGFMLYGAYGDSLRFTNWGAPTTYSATLLREASDHLVVPLREDMPIGAGHTHWITPGTWPTIDTSCIYIAIDNTGDMIIDTVLCGTAGVEERRSRMSPGHLEILGSRPNPVGQQMSVDFANPRPQTVTISLWDVTGKEMGILSDIPWGAGNQTFWWAPGSREALPDGIYFMQFQAGVETRFLRITLSR